MKRPIEKVGHILAHISAARAYASASKAVRRRVGAVLVKANNPVASGWNGMPKGMDNCCETQDGQASRPEVVHAEVNTYLKLIKLNESSEGSDLYVTCLPCESCAKFMIEHTLTRRVFFAETYRSLMGGVLLLKEGFELFYVDEEEEAVYEVYGVAGVCGFNIRNVTTGEERIIDAYEPQ